MRILNKIYAGVVAAGIGFTTAAAFADDIRVGITMRMVSENGQAYGQMMMDEIKAINEAGGILNEIDLSVNKNIKIIASSPDINEKLLKKLNNF